MFTVSHAEGRSDIIQACAEILVHTHSLGVASVLHILSQWCRLSVFTELPLGIDSPDEVIIQHYSMSQKLDPWFIFK